MILIDNTCISDDIADQFFVCNLEKCKGACCVEGDSGAPLEDDELPVLADIYEAVEPYLTEEGKAAIARQGVYTTDFEGDYVTPIIENRECAYAFYDSDKTLKCGIEQAYLDGKISYKKPISCHLYPIRVDEYRTFTALNYHKWEICDDACTLGKELQVPIYKFVKTPLIRKYGEEFYKTLCDAADEWKIEYGS